MKNKDFALQLGSDAILAFVDGQLNLDTNDHLYGWATEHLTPETAREIRSLVDMYLYNLYIAEEKI